MALHVVCGDGSDLPKFLSENGIGHARYAYVDDALNAAEYGDGVAILANGYPDEPTPCEDRYLESAARMQLRGFIEYPSRIPGASLEGPFHAQKERGVVTAPVFGKELRPMTILAIHDCHYVSVESQSPWLSLAKVAGFDTAVYGLPADSSPLLFEQQKDTLLVATTRLSQMISSRYAPRYCWCAVWERILQWLLPEDTIPPLTYQPVVDAAFGKEAVMPHDFERRAAENGAHWYRSSRLLVDSSWQSEIERAASYDDCVAPAPERRWATGNGGLGILEGHSSAIKHDGSQYVRWYTRADCNCESAMALALTGLMSGESVFTETACNLLDYVYAHSAIQRGPRADVQSPSCGLLGWDTRPEGLEIYYGDDNARALLGTICAAAVAAAAVAKTNRWNDGVMKAAIGNFRTSGKHGYRGNNKTETTLQESGWQELYNAGIVNPSPHFESWLWAVYLWLYNKTGYEPLLERTYAGVSNMMACYPDGWLWTNGVQQERARMMLPLAWLIRVDDTTKHRNWLRRVASDLINCQDACGAIREEIGVSGLGKYGPPATNEDYGTSEASLLQTNGDQVCDLLYTSNFAFAALHEASAATGETYYAHAEATLAHFLCRIQARSTSRAEFDGAWFRAFDFNGWEYWGSNADIGWGPWSTETGWIQGWITATLAHRVMGTNLWDLAASLDVAEQFDYWKGIMLPDV